MIEFPEALCLSAQIRRELTGKTVSRVLPPFRRHKFCWFNGDPADYGPRLQNAVVSGAEGFGMFVELLFDNGELLCVNDGVNMRLLTPYTLPEATQLALIFTDGTALAFTVAMYGGIVLHREDYDNPYYLGCRRALSPFSGEFRERFRRLLTESKQTLSAKAFLATEQRFPGLGNGVLQDILFTARVNPRTKLSQLGEDGRRALEDSTVAVLGEMLSQGGRDTEKDIFGRPGGYHTRMSRSALCEGCPDCGGSITKEAYLGGSVYYCRVCQK